MLNFVYTQRPKKKKKKGEEFGLNIWECREIFFVKSRCVEIFLCKSSCGEKVFGIKWYNINGTKI